MDFNTLKKNLINYGYKVSEFTTKTEAASYIVGEVTGKTVGFGGSMTLKEMGLYEKLSENNDVEWHWAVKEGMTPKSTIEKEQISQIYFSSVNAIAETGEIINIDGNCNRIAAMMFGHEKVYLVAGENKIEKTYEKALFRARNTAAPLNAKRLNALTPCAAQGNKCYDCKSPDRICKGLSVFMQKPSMQEYEVILIHESLGY